MENHIIESALFRKLLMIYTLNVCDWICTVVLLQTSLFYEANPITRSFIGSLSQGFAVKCILPAVILFIVARIIRHLDNHERRIADCLISFCLVFYLAISLDHIVNFILIAAV